MGRTPPPGLPREERRPRPTQEHGGQANPDTETGEQRWAGWRWAGRTQLEDRDGSDAGGRSLVRGPSAHRWRRKPGEQTGFVLPLRPRQAWKHKGTLSGVQGKRGSAEVRPSRRCPCDRNLSMSRGSRRSQPQVSALLSAQGRGSRGVTRGKPSQRKGPAATLPPSLLQRRGERPRNWRSVCEGTRMRLPCRQPATRWPLRSGWEAGLGPGPAPRWAREEDTFPASSRCCLAQRAQRSMEEQGSQTSGCNKAAGEAERGTQAHHTWPQGGSCLLVFSL